MSTIYCDLQYDVSIEEVMNTLNLFSKNFPFVDFLNEKDSADFFTIQNSNHCLIKLYKHHNDKKIVLVSLIDNLMKGAAGQAVQCFNLIFNFDEKLGLNNKL
jgi:N-acetyl-gamma-glutamyl-phosphate reductase